MNCTDFELAVHDRLDARQTDLTPELAAHAASCDSCRTFWRAQLTLLAAAKSWCAPDDVPAGLVDAVLVRLSRPERLPSSTTGSSVASQTALPASRHALVATICSTAALIALAVFLIPAGPRENPHESALAKTGTSDAAEPVAREAELVSETLIGLWGGVRAEYVELSQETTRAFDWSELPDSAEFLPTLPLGEMPDSEQPASWLRLDRPVSERVGQAFDFLWDALPAGAPQSS